MLQTQNPDVCVAALLRRGGRDRPAFDAWGPPGAGCPAEASRVSRAALGMLAGRQRKDFCVGRNAAAHHAAAKPGWGSQSGSASGP